MCRIKISPNQKTAKIKLYQLNKSWSLFTLVLQTEKVEVCVFYLNLTWQSALKENTRVVNLQTLVWGLRLLVILQIFLLLFHIWSKRRLFRTFHHKTSSKHPKNSIFWLYFTKIFCDFKQSVSTQLCLGRPMDCGSVYVKHSVNFSDFFETQCRQTWKTLQVFNRKINYEILRRSRN